MSILYTRKDHSHEVEHIIVTSSDLSMAENNAVNRYIVERCMDGTAEMASDFVRLHAKLLAPSFHARTYAVPTSINR